MSEEVSANHFMNDSQTEELPTGTRTRRTRRPEARKLQIEVAALRAPGRESRRSSPRRGEEDLPAASVEHLLLPRPVARSGGEEARQADF